MKEIVLAADLGGTNIRMAAVDRSGQILARESRLTPTGEGASILTELVSIANELRAAADPDGNIATLGIALPGAIDLRELKVVQSPNLPHLDGFELGAKLKEMLSLRVVMENDATAAAIGENWLGASRNVRNSICVTLGTGVGGGIIVDGEPLRGTDGTAGEIGHMSVVYDGAECGCGSFGCIEQYASATAIVRMAGELAVKYPDSKLAGSHSFSSEDIYNAGVAGDALSLEVFRSMGAYLGTTLAGVINLLNPEMIVIGGGAAAGWDLFIGHVRELIDKKAYRRSAERVKIVRAVLGDDAGIMGAAKLAFDTRTGGLAK